VCGNSRLQIIRWLDTSVADGFILGLPVVAEGLGDFIKHVIPVLEARGRYSRRLMGKTLRDYLSLPRRESRYTLVQAQRRDSPGSSTQP
jgi:hypothetical protein